MAMDDRTESAAREPVMSAEGKPLKGKAATQQRILSAAASLFVERGYEGTTIAEVAEAAGVSRATVFWHFSDKAGLFREAFSFLVRPFRDSLERDLGELPPRKRLLEQIGHYQNMVRTGSDREEAAQSFPAGNTGAFIWHRRL